MPLLKGRSKSQPNWRKWDQLAQKEGMHHTVHAVNGNTYTGEWKDNKMHGEAIISCSIICIIKLIIIYKGKGQYVWKKSGALYDGDWKEDERNGFGTYSIVRDGSLVKEYAGGWKNDMRHGYGTRFYGSDDYYEGEWYGDERSGWGRMYFQDGSVYEGEWLEDKRHGRGLLRLGQCSILLMSHNYVHILYTACGNRYEGLWKSDMKNGPGKFMYLNKGQVYTGEWVDDIPVCGLLEDVERERAPDPPVYPIPKVLKPIAMHIHVISCKLHIHSVP